MARIIDSEKLLYMFKRITLWAIVLWPAGQTVLFKSDGTHSSYARRIPLIIPRYPKIAIPKNPNKIIIEINFISFYLS